MRFSFPWSEEPRAGRVPVLISSGEKSHFRRDCLLVINSDIRQKFPEENHQRRSAQISPESLGK